MIKEIHDQPESFLKALSVPLASLLEPHTDRLNSAESIEMIACGTSYHAGMIAEPFFEELTRLRTSARVASEARYRTLPFHHHSLVIALSQSGETADTLAAAKEAKAKDALLIAITNNPLSTLARLADLVIDVQAGIEISVCSTKTFTSTLAILYRLALYLGSLKQVISSEARALYTTLLHQAVPTHLEKALQMRPQLWEMGKRYAHFDNFFFIGRSYMYPTALEASLKLKEISYAHSEAYPAGELKHGAIALLTPQFPVIALACHQYLFTKTLNSVMEVQARQAPILVIAFESTVLPKELKADTLLIPDIVDAMAPFAVSVIAQLLAYFISLARGLPIDKPRNLAKSVTVE
jgi:glucosamine--fructose-6-phosphate aminotransferase (isomerizing)